MSPRRLTASTLGLLLALTVGSGPGFASGIVPMVSDSLTAAEREVQRIIAGDGLHVVHFWSPWCGNSRAELATGWYEVIERAGEDVTFTFVTVWNDGESGRDVLDHYAVPAHVREIPAPDRGPSEDPANRRRTFLSLPVTWTPTTWIFRQNGQLAYAFNYGELDAAALQQALDNARSPWTHD